MPANGDGAIGIAWDQRHEVLDCDARARQRWRPAVCISELNAGRFQAVVLFEHAGPVLAPPGQDLDHLLGQVSGVEHHDINGYFVLDALFHQCNGQRHVRPEVLMPCPKLGILERHRVDRLMQAMARFFVS